MKKTAVVLALLLLTSCIYIIPQARKVSIQQENGSEYESIPIPDFVLKTDYPKKYTIKAVENFHDECDGCYDYISASAAAMRHQDPSLEFPFIMALSGAAGLKDRDSAISEFFDERMGYYGFEAAYFSAGTTKKMEEFYNKHNIEPVPMNSISFLKSLIYSDAVVIVSLDSAYLSSTRDLYNLPDKSSEFIFADAVGYSAEIQINDPTINNIKSSYQNIPAEEFIRAWNSSKNSYGSMFSALLIRRAAPATDEEAIGIIKKDIEASHKNLLESREPEKLIMQAAITRQRLYEYLKDINRPLALNLKESSIRFKKLAEKKDSLNIKDIIDYEKKAIDELK